MDYEVSRIKNQVVKVNNYFINSTNDMSPLQEKIFSVALKELELINKNKELKDKSDTVVLDGRELLNYFGMKVDKTHKSNYSLLCEEVTSLKFKAHFHFVEENGAVHDGFLIYDSVYEPGGKISLSFGGKYLDMLTDFYERYTRYLQDDYVYFKSKGAMSLYKMLMEKSFLIEQKKKVRFTTEELKAILQVAPDAYISKGKFNRGTFEARALNKAIDEIEEKAKCISHLCYHKVKQGRAVKFYEFSYDYKDPDDVVYSSRSNKKIGNREDVVKVDDAEFMSLIEELKRDIPPKNIN